MTLRAAYVTLLTNTEYLPGVLVLEYSLRSVDSKYPLVVMVTNQLPVNARNVLERRKIAVCEVDPLLPAEGTHSLSEADARFYFTWTKLRFISLQLPIVQRLLIRRTI